jgi:hypothetical protein
MPDCAAAGLTNKLGQACLMDPLAATGVDADRAHVRQAFDQTEHSVRRGRLWHLPQPSQPALAGLFSALRQRIKPAALFG